MWRKILKLTQVAKTSRGVENKRLPFFMSLLFATVVLAALMVVAITAYRIKQGSQVHSVTDNTVVRQYREKLPSLKVAASQKPNDAAAHSAYAQALYVTGDKKAARQEYETAVSLSPKNASIRNNLANVYRDLKEYTSAADTYRKAYELDPTLINAYVNLATMQAYTLKKPADAVATYKLAVTKNGQSPELLLLLGGAYELNHQTDLALASYRNVLAKDSTNAAAKRNIERLTKH